MFTGSSLHYRAYAAQSIRETGWRKARSWDGTALYTCVVPVRDDALILRRYYPTRDIGVLG